jgi:hypothetical protein
MPLAGWAAVLMLLGAQTEISAAPENGDVVRKDTSFGRVHVHRGDAPAAIAEGTAAQEAAERVLGLGGMRFEIVDPRIRPTPWGALSDEGLPIYPWEFGNSPQGTAPRPPAHVLRHEIGHDLFIRHLVPSTNPDQYGGDAPDWLDEMAAIAFEGTEQVAIRRQQARLIASHRGLLPLRRFFSMVHPELAALRRSAPGAQPTSEPAPDPLDTPLFYLTGRAFYDFLVFRTGNAAIVAGLAAAVRGGEALDRWLTARTGFGEGDDGFDALEAAFAAWVLSEAYGDEEGATAQAVRR